VQYRPAAVVRRDGYPVRLLVGVEADERKPSVVVGDPVYPTGFLEPGIAEFDGFDLRYSGTRNPHPGEERDGPIRTADPSDGG